MSHLLDTRAAVDIIRGRKPAARRHFVDAIRRRTAVFLPTVTLFELKFGIERSAQRDRNAALLDDLLSVPLGTLPFDDEDAGEAARLRAALERAGTPVGPYDLMIAAQASRRRWTIVTANVAEFRRVPEQVVEDWS